MADRQGSSTIQRMPPELNRVETEEILQFLGILAVRGNIAMGSGAEVLVEV